MRNIHREDWAYLAGLIDGDGCFSISITAKKDHINVSPRISIRIKANDGQHLIELQKKFAVGKIYWHKIMTADSIRGWYILKVADCIWITENILEFLRIKHHKATRFLEACLYWQSTALTCPERMRGYRHPKDQMLHIIDIACNLNFDRQTVRYRNKKGMEHWKSLIESLYSS